MKNYLVIWFLSLSYLPHVYSQFRNLCGNGFYNGQIRERNARINGLLCLQLFRVALYGGYFGGVLGVITIAALGLFIEEASFGLNALKQLLSLSINVAAALFFLFSGQVYWLVAAVMAVCAFMDGTIGGKLAGKFKPVILRWVIVAIGLIAAIIFFVK